MIERPESEQGRHPPPAADAERGASQDVDAGRAPSEASTRAESGAEEAADAVERDLDALEETRRERDEYLELAQRTKADFENYRKRVSSEAEAAQRRGQGELAAELVPVLDNLERALTAAGIDPASALDGRPDSDGGLEHGVILTYRDLRETLGRAGVEPFEPGGEKFDPEWHEALSTRPDEGAGPGVVLDVVQKGYRLDGRLIRPARVVVSE